MRRTRITDEESRTNESPRKSKNRRANNHPSDGAEFAREFGHKAVPGVAPAGEQEHDAASQMQTLYLRAREDAQARVHARIRRTTQPTAGGKYFHFFSKYIFLDFTPPNLPLTCHFGLGAFRGRYVFHLAVRSSTGTGLKVSLDDPLVDGTGLRNRNRDF
ncbi:unnamed protein product [Cylindrotheca closterium]|uniref:Uncharacterized protein n=1 Tax=Cylindrotheca closterium TaxID=2856 RepID=A0AAD2PY99_9STRA|nr:unnamed protein product [Cylindrotheca closterium]